MLKNAVFLLACAALVAACAEKKIPLKGERLDPRAVVGAGEDNVPAPAPGPHRVAVSLPAPRVNAEWTQRNGGATHAMTQPALGTNLSPLWAVQIGRGDDKRHQITADPVVAAGRVYTLDSEATVSAVSVAGQKLWSTDITPPGDRRGKVSGGGLAFGDGKLFVTTAYGELIALNPASGQVLWRQKLDAPATGAPAVVGNTVYVASRNAVGWAVNAADGKLRWSLQGTSSIGSLTGGPAPAVSGSTVIFPFSSGDMVAAKAQSGLVTWSTPVAGSRLGHVYAQIPDIAGDPVIVGGTVYAGNATGRVGAYSLESGEADWTSDEGTLGPVWPAGGQLYLISDENKLVRLNASTGVPIWKAPLPYYKPYRKEKKRRDIYQNFGPVLAGNHLVVPSSDGSLKMFDPASGALVSQIELGAPATTDAAVANRTLYVVTADGKLRAFR
ncbi:outer membrane protein assembly factor BamB family protein [Acidimangrovimonas sediminis]|uniref:outer membrane protein assembly factor BamB family protein n=1 Tax=Acidimangrovimonas sediminis TaxID=2056283 RepID=UPI000C7F9A42|nr:PQQ-like beta-propeller repeat protein [Acidimangrovimonas sediminis]